MTRADLPEPNTGLWVASRKAAVVRAVTSGLIKRDDALEMYEISSKEYDGWQSMGVRNGGDVLKETVIQRYEYIPIIDF